jgi:hypothetical protein
MGIQHIGAVGLRGRHLPQRGGLQVEIAVRQKAHGLGDGVIDQHRAASLGQQAEKRDCRVQTVSARRAFFRQAATNRQKPVKFDKFYSNYRLYYTTNDAGVKHQSKLLTKPISCRGRAGFLIKSI